MGHLIAVAGPAGAGKSTLATVLAARMNAEHLDFDDVTRVLVDTERGRRGPIEEYVLLRELRLERYALLEAAACRALRQDDTVIVSAPFTSHVCDPDSWAAWESALPDGTRSTLVWLDLPPEERARRMQQRQSPRDASTLAAAIPVSPLPRVPHLRVDASASTVEQADRVLAHLR